MIMKTKRFLIPALLLAAGVAARAADTNMLTLAVFDFDARQMSMPDVGSNVALILNAALSADPNLITVERAELGKVLGEHELTLSGNVSGDTAAKVGQLTGAKVLVTGRVFMVDNETIIVAKIIGTETAGFTARWSARQREIPSARCPKNSPNKSATSFRRRVTHWWPRSYRARNASIAS